MSTNEVKISDKDLILSYIDDLKSRTDRLYREYKDAE